MRRPPSIIQGAVIGGLLGGALTASGVAATAATVKYGAHKLGVNGRDAVGSVLELGAPSVVATAAVGAVTGAAIQAVRRATYDGAEAPAAMVLSRPRRKRRKPRHRR